MKVELEDHDIQAIARRVAEVLGPQLRGSSPPQEPHGIFDVQGLARYLHVDPSWIYKQVQLKTIPYFKTGKYVRFRKSAIDTWIESTTVPPRGNVESSQRLPMTR